MPHGKNARSCGVSFHRFVPREMRATILEIGFGKTLARCASKVKPGAARRTRARSNQFNGPEFRTPREQRDGTLPNPTALSPMRSAAAKALPAVDAWEAGMPVSCPRQTLRNLTMLQKIQGRGSVFLCPWICFAALRARVPCGTPRINRNDAVASGANGQRGRSRRQLAAELRCRRRSNRQVRLDRSTNGGRGARSGGADGPFHPDFD
jgi:hypothetical protein